MIRDTNLLSIFALIISVIVGVVLYVTRDNATQYTDAEVEKINTEITGKSDLITELQKTMKKDTGNAVNKNEDFVKQLATTAQSLIDLDKKVTTLSGNISELDDKLDASNKAFDAAKAEIVKAAVGEVQKKQDAQADKEATETTISDQKTTIDGETARNDWVQKFTLLEADYIVLDCYSSELFKKVWYWPFGSSYSIPADSHTEISAILVELSKIAVSTLDAKGITSMNTKYQPMNDEIFNILTTANTYIDDEKSGDSNFANVVKECGSLQIIDK